MYSILCVMDPSNWFCLEIIKKTQASKSRHIGTIFNNENIKMKRNIRRGYETFVK